LKDEGLDLAILKRLFHQTGPTPIEANVKNAPTGAYSWRLWFLYEWLLEQQLDLPDAASGRYVEAVDTKLQWARLHSNLEEITALRPPVLSMPCASRPDFA
jgi:hypothetical protein